MRLAFYHFYCWVARDFRILFHMRRGVNWSNLVNTVFRSIEIRLPVLPSEPPCGRVQLPRIGMP